MISAFFIQSILAILFFGALAGIGAQILSILRIKRHDAFLHMALAYFLSLCLYTILAVMTLFVFPDKLLTLKVFTLAYAALSYLIIGYKLLKRKFSREQMMGFIRQEWVTGAFFVFVSAVFFLGIYETALLDEWLHRPVVKFFLENNQFPLKNPYDFASNFTMTYHYGMQVVAASVENIAHLGVSEALDVVKISVVIATFFLLHGVFQAWGVSRRMASFGAVLTLFAGGSFFLFDAFTASHLGLWGQKVNTFNYSLLYTLNGITWVNVPLAFACLLVVEDLLYHRSDTRIRVMAILAILLAGLFLISELFGVVLLLSIVFLMGRMLLKKRAISEILPAVGILVLIAVGAIYIGGGLLTKTLAGKPSLSQFLTLRNPSDWGYPTAVEILSPLRNFEIYLRNFLLEFIAIVGLVLLVFKKKISLKSHPLLIGVGIAMFAIPFIFSTSFNDLNLYKLTHLGIFLVHVAFFAYIMRQSQMWLKGATLALFIFAALPIVFVNGMMQWGDSPKAKSLRCAENELCYKDKVQRVLKKMQKTDPGIKKVLVAPIDAEKVVSLSNSYAVNYAPGQDISMIDAQYVFVTPELRSILTPEQLVYLQSLKKVSEKGGYAVYVIE